MRVLLVEDEMGLRQGIEVALRASGFGVDSTVELAAAERLAGEHSYDCVVLDRMLPDGDGLGMVREGRLGSPVPPVLVLTARDAIRDRVEGLEAGADDYVVKPFAMAELIARVRALCRRGESITPRVLELGGLEIDAARHEVRREGVLLSLTVKEHAVLEYLATRAGEVVSREALVAHCWDRLTEPMSNAVDVVISQLRRKLGEPSPILTVRGAGYRLEPR